MGQGPGLIRGEVTPGKRLCGRTFQRFNHESFGQIIQSTGLGHGVRAYPGTAQGGQVTTGAESGAQVACE
jgi:hypothetical protein